MAKAKVTLLVDRETYETFKHNVRRYPRGVASFVFQQAMEKINIEYEAAGRSQQLDLLLNK